MSDDENTELIEARKKLEQLQQAARETFMLHHRAECAVQREVDRIRKMEFAMIGIKGRRKFTYHNSYEGVAESTPDKIETEWELTTENKWRLIAVDGRPIAKGQS